MLAGEISKNQRASEQLLSQISEVIFATMDRYLEMKDFYPDSASYCEHGRRFPSKGASRQELDEAVGAHDMTDLAETYRRAEGGKERLVAEYALSAYLKDQKVTLLAAKLKAAAGISDAYKERIVKLASERAARSWPSFEEVRAAVVEQRCWAVNAVKAASWEDLEIDVPHISLEAKRKITSYPYAGESLSGATPGGFEDSRLTYMQTQMYDSADDPLPSDAQSDMWSCPTCTMLNEASLTNC